MKKFIYEVLDILTLGKGFKKHISGFSLRIPTRYFKYFESNYELNNINFINNNVTKGMTVIDVGSHLGLLTIILSKKVGTCGKVFALEPTPLTFELLKKTISINKANNSVIAINKAVSEKSGTFSFYITNIEAHNSNSLVNNNRKEDNEKKIDTEIVSIDDLAKEYSLTNLDFMKIDAEGAEYSILKGAKEVIDKFHPKIILALHPESIRNFGDTLSDIWDFICSKKYTIIYNNEKLNKDTFINQSGLFDVFLI